MNLSYIFRESFSGFRRAKLSSAVSIFTIAVSLVLLGIFATVTLNAVKVLNSIRDRIEVEMFLDETVTDDAAKEMASELSKANGVRGVRFVSKADAENIFEQQSGEKISVVLGFNPLPKSLKVSMQTEYANLDSLEKFAKSVSVLTGVMDTKYNKEFLRGIDKNAKILSYITVGLGLVISLASIFLVSNTIRLAIYAKREIIRTMKLVGATNLFIRLPFLIEGLLQGFIGGAIAASSLYVLIELGIRRYYPTIYEVVTIAPVLYGTMLAVGMGLGFVGSVFSVRKFLNE
jgi:cell division transport system permease protein